ncbi:MAG: hypothetical protein VR65_08020 [Desulfobulbaceae bacterium BRH_c16a]|nr:MAG: hypothetical protein VR65_08020 [Desulfobulbaceae bacterium BRH_c16a]
MSSRHLIDRVKALIYDVYVFIMTHGKEFLRWRKQASGGVGCRVFYGHDHIPSPGEKASGGIIKCQDLQKDFPNVVRGANVLYLVSSALPTCPEILVKYTKKSCVKLIVNQNGVAFPAYHGNNLEKMNGPRRFLLQQADHVIYQSDYCKISADKYLTDTVENYSILHNPVDVQFFLPAKKPARPTKPVLLMAGSHGFFYRISSAVQVLSSLKKLGIEAKLMIYGRLAWKNDAEECRKELIAVCRKYGAEDMVEFGKSYRQIDAPSIYQSADLLIHTQYNDACPRTVVEAMACGLPIVYSKSGGVPELVGEEAGRGVSVPMDWEKVHPPNPDQMAEAVVEVLSSIDQYATAARERAVKRFDVRDWLEAHKKIFETVLGQDR